MADRFLSTTVSAETMLVTITPEIASTLIYPVRGKFGLSKKGVDWACRELAKRNELIRVIGDPVVQPDPLDEKGEHIVIVIKAGRYTIDEGVERLLDTRIGSSRGWTKQEVENEKKETVVVLDEKWFEKTMSRAQRNAMRALLPESFVVAAIARAAGGGTKVAEAAKEAAAAARKDREASKTEKKTADAPAGRQEGTVAKPEGQVEKKDNDIRQRLYAVMSGVEKDKEKMRDLLFALTKHRKTSELDEKIVNALTSAMHGVVKSLNKIIDNSDGTKCIVNAKDEGVVFGSRVQIPSQTGTPGDTTTSGEKMSTPADADPF